ncbi:hypothetical protein [Enterobacter hormaechei]|uniref:hypothetical protein n=1 Tax=Enterobacter hormaechei TaxID=158836 RepID=UPI0032DB8129
MNASGIHPDVPGSRAFYFQQSLLSVFFKPGTASESQYFGGGPGICFLFPGNDCADMHGLPVSENM